QTLPGVHSVRTAKAILDPIFTAVDIFKWGAFGVGAFLVVTALLLVANTLRLAVLAQRREIGTMRLVGASSLYISLPFLLEAVVTTLVGVVLAAGAPAAFVQFGVQDGLAESLRFMPWVDMTDYAKTLVWVGAIGPVLTVVPTLVLTRK